MFDFEAMRQRPSDFRVLERVPFTAEGLVFPLVIDCAAGDEVPIVLLDCETTGFDVDTCGVTELGLTRVAYSPSLGRITSIVDSKSWLNDPGHPVPEFITQLTGLTSEAVQGKRIQAEDIADFFEGDPVVIAHNAAFDRGFCERHLPIPANLRWGCSANEIDWSGAGLESRKLEFIVYRLGGFYGGHRADIDTLALTWVLFRRPELLAELLGNVEKDTVIVRALYAPFEKKDDLKANGFKWDDGSGSYPKHWHYTGPADELDAVMAFLEGIYPARNCAEVERVTARERFR